MLRNPVILFCGLLSVGLIALGVAYFTPAVESAQVGFRGVGMVQHKTESELTTLAALNIPPEVLDEPYPDDGSSPRASEVYENVQVLGDLSEENFLRLMTAITEWVSPEQGCEYCHNLEEGWAWDGVYTKLVSRRMIQMTRSINADWSSHVQGVDGEGAGVTCYTCHRGLNVPQYIWFTDTYRDRGLAGNRAGLAGSQAAQNLADPEVNWSSLPADPFTPYLLGDEEIRYIGDQPLPDDTPSEIKQTERTYALMIHMSQSLGVNCTYCHNSRNFQSWEQSQPTRVTAWYGIEMTRALNVDYLNPLQPVYPHYRLGEAGDAPKAYCTTCHQGAAKPLYGANVIGPWPSLAGPGQAAQGDYPLGTARPEENPLLNPELSEVQSQQ